MKTNKLISSKQKNTHQKPPYKAISSQTYKNVNQYLQEKKRNASTFKNPSNKLQPYQTPYRKRLLSAKYKNQNPYKINNILINQSAIYKLKGLNQQLLCSNNSGLDKKKLLFFNLNNNDDLLIQENHYHQKINKGTKNYSAEKNKNYYNIRSKISTPIKQNNKESKVKEKTIQKKIYYQNIYKKICQEKNVDRKKSQQLYVRKKEIINVGTLNFSGINISPFEYDDGSENMIQMNEIFKDILSKQFNQIKQFEIGKIDKEFQSGRASLWYGWQPKLIDNKLPNKQQFQQQWTHNFNEWNKQKHKKFDQSHIKNTIDLDYLNYITIVKLVYKKQQNHIKQLDPIKFFDYLKSKTIDRDNALQIKKQKVIKYIKNNNIDVMFLQQASSITWQNSLNNFEVINNADSVILFNKKKITKPNTQLYQRYKLQLNFNNDTAFYFSDNNFLLISAHLKAKQINIKQAQQMFKVLSKIKQNQTGIKIIVGIDANHFITQDKSIGFSIFPKNQNTPTTKKKRTYLQAQLVKAGKPICQVKDLIISNYQLNSCIIQDITNQPIKNQWIPNIDHPYDHFIVKASFINNPKLKIKNQKITNQQIIQAVYDQVSSPEQSYYKQLSSPGKCFRYTQQFEQQFSINQTQKINVGTLNFSGINISPFEYDDGSENMIQMNEIFKDILSKQFNQIKQFEIGKIDKEFQSGRASLWYGWQPKLINNKLPNKQQFQQQWTHNFNEWNKQKHKKFDQSHIKNTIDLDYLNYITIVKLVYKKSQSHIKQLDPIKFFDYLKSKTIDRDNALQIKKQKVIKYIKSNNIDVMFLQQASSITWQNSLNNFEVINNADSVILFNKKKITKPNTQLYQRYKLQLNFNNDTAFYFSDNNFLLISAHLKAKQINIKQAQQMFKVLSKIQQNQTGIKIIVGIDANHFITQDKSIGFSIFPKNQNTPTTKKKRTYLQAQLVKAGKPICQVKDLIISNYQLNSCIIQDITNQPIKNQWIPNIDHPYDHFIVKASFINNPKLKIKNQKITNQQIIQAVYDQVSSPEQSYYKQLSSPGKCFRYTQQFEQQFSINQTQKINVGTLNFSGINISPFEYDDGSENMIQMNEIFKDILSKQFNQIKQFEIGKIDKEFQSGRASLWYGWQPKLINNKLPNKQQFQQQWTHNFNEWNKQKHKKFDQSHIKNTIDLDYLNYITIVKLVYKKSQSHIKQLDPIKFFDYLKSKTIDRDNALQIKKQKVIKYIKSNNIDVMFLQQASSITWQNSLNNFEVINNADSVILFNKKKITKPNTQLYQRYKLQLNFNNDTAFYFSDNNFLLISAHLKAKQINIKQAQQMFKVLSKIQQNQTGIKIIVGIDANHFITQDKSIGFSIFPKNQNTPTTKKKRTYLQAQLVKAGKPICQVKDLIISNYQLNSCIIQDITNQPIKNQWIPNIDHPYDHFIVKASFINNPKLKIKNQKITNQQIIQAVYDQVSSPEQSYYKQLSSPGKCFRYTQQFEQQFSINQTQKINVGTLNFSGINISPFEYDDGSENMIQMNEIFKDILSKQFNQIKQFEIGKIDKEFQSGRASLWYGWQPKLINNKLPNKQQFQQQWTHNFNEWNKQKHKKFDQSHIKNTIDLDYLNYITIVKLVYKKSQSHIKQLDPIKFFDYLKSKTIDRDNALQIKKQKVIKYIKSNNIDVMFLQQASSITWQNSLNNFEVINNADSVILFNKKKITKPNTQLYQRYKLQLNFNNDTAFYFSDNNFLLISAHLKAKQINIKQAQQMFKVLSKIQQNQTGIKIIVGIDANHFITQDKSIGFSIFPKNQNTPTTKKKRTYLQAQLVKAGKPICQVKDLIISNYQLNSCIIQDITNQPIKNQWIPNIDHPYDHFIVKASIKLSSSNSDLSVEYL